MGLQFPNDRPCPHNNDTNATGFSQKLLEIIIVTGGFQALKLSKTAGGLQKNKTTRTRGHLFI